MNKQKNCATSVSSNETSTDTSDANYFYFADEDLLYKEEEELPDIPPFPSIWGDSIK